MLNKVKLGILIGFVLQVARVFLPDIEVPEGLADAVVLIVVFVAQFFIRETSATVAGLSLK
jgi:hypothetical protein